MIDSKKLLFALVVLQIATLSLLLLIFLSPARGVAPGSTFVIKSGREQTQPVSVSQTELRALIRAEIESRETAGSSAAEENQSGEDPRDQEQAIAASGSIIRQAIAAGAWTRADTEALLPHLGKFPAAERRALMDEFYTAVNRQELAIDDFPPL